MQSTSRYPRTVRLRYSVIPLWKRENVSAQAPRDRYTRSRSSARSFWRDPRSVPGDGTHVLLTPLRTEGMYISQTIVLQSKTVFCLQLPVRPADETAQVTADTATSTTKKKFAYTPLLRELHCDDEAEGDQLSTIFMRCIVLSDLVKGLACTACHSSTLAVRAVDCALAVVCTLEAHCTSCGEILNKTKSSGRLGGVKFCSVCCGAVPRVCHDGHGV